MKLHLSTLRLKIFLGMTVVLAGFALVVTGVVGSMVDRFIELEMSNSLGRALDAYGEFARQRRERLTEEVLEVARLPELGQLSFSGPAQGNDVRTLLSQVRAESDVDLFLVADERGILVTDFTEATGTRSLADRPGMADVLTGSEFYGVWQYDGAYYSVSVAPILAPDQVAGVSGLVALGHAIDAAAAHELAALTSTHVIFTQGAEPIAWSLIDAPGRNALDAWLSQRKVDDTTTPLREQGLSLGGVEHVAQLAALPGGEASMIICRPVDDVIAPFLRARNDILVVGGLMLLIALFVSRSLSLRVTQPIQAITEAANAMSRGDLNTKVVIETHDELATLGLSFNAMARNMRALVEGAKEEARHAARAAEAKSAFLATMSHELRTPLNGILGFSEELMHGRMSDEQREYAELVHRSGYDLKNIIDSVLSYSQIEAGRASIERSRFRLHTSVERTTGPIAEMAAIKGLEMTVTVDPEVPEVVLGSKIRFEKILQVLVDNAVRFTDSGRVSVRASLEAGSAEEALVRVSVRDTGVGLTEDQLALVFNPFMQVSQAANRSHGGSGLGLAIARDLAEQMGGSCDVESEPGFGSIFWFTIAFELPGAESAARSEGGDAEPEEVDAQDGFDATAEADEPPALPSRDRIAWNSEVRRGKRVLVVEDNPVNQKMAVMLLRKAGLEYEVADNGEQALAVLDEQSFDLILMDCQMPVLDGFETTRRIRARESGTEHRTPILALTANTMEGDRETCLSAGMDGFIGKPFTAETLILTLDRWFDSQDTAA